MIGHWIKKPSQRCSGRYCSICGNHEPYERNFCPECGAEMVDIKLMTNANRIRSMSDEELATDLLLMFEELCEDGIPNQEYMRNWLQQLAEEDN